MKVNARHLHEAAVMIHKQLRFILVRKELNAISISANHDPLAGDKPDDREFYLLDPRPGFGFLDQCRKRLARLDGSHILGGRRQ